MDIPPSQTLYVQNVSDKLKKEMVKRQLYLAFSPFGRIMDVIACKGETLRGQAWVVYDSVNSATTALRSMNGFPFFGKPLVGDQDRDELC
jgi:RNA recognition motif-containing protein